MAVDSLSALRDQLEDRPVRPIHIPASSSSGEVVGKACLLVGWSMRETAGAAAHGTFLNGSGTGTGIAGEFSLAANGATTDPLTDEGVLCENGLFLSMGTGTVEGCAYVRV